MIVCHDKVVGVGSGRARVVLGVTVEGIGMMAVVSKGLPKISMTGNGSFSKKGDEVILRLAEIARL